MWLLSISCCFVAGVALAVGGHSHPAIVSAAAVVVWLLASREWRPRGAIVLLLCITCAFAGALLYDKSAEPSPNPLSRFAGQEQVTVKGRISAAPEPAGVYQRVVLNSLDVDTGQGAEEVDGRLSATLRYPGPLHYGDMVSLCGALESPQNFSDFDYVGYLEQQGIFATMFCPAVLEVETPHSSGPIGQLHAFNDSLNLSLERTLPQPEASLAQTLLLGRRDSLSDEVRDDFARAGAAHLLAVSGLHLAIVTAVVLTIALALLGRWKYLYVWIALAAVVFYVLLTGMRPPVVRAGIMAGVFLMAELAGRQKHGATALAFAAAVMVAVEPGLVAQTSFQLSFLAMTGLVVLYRPLRDCFDSALHHANPDSDRPARLLSPCLDIVAATIAASIMTLPVIAREFGALPVLAIPVSVLALPILPFSIAGAAFAAIGGLLSHALGVVSGWAAWLPLTYLLDLTRLASQLDSATFSVGAPPLSVEMAYYLAVLSGALLWRRTSPHEKERRDDDIATPTTSRLWYAAPPLLLVAIIVWSAVVAAPDGKLHVTFFDVGQGDACLVKTPEGHTVVVDGGRDGTVMSHYLGKAIPFWDHSIDVIVDTHQHEDHLAGLLTVVRHYDVGLAVCPEYAEETALGSEWGRLLSERNIPLETVHSTRQLDLGDGATVEIVGPPDTRTFNNCDDNSVVLRVCYGDVVFLLTGDIGSGAETDLCYSVADMDCTVLKVAHHGSDTSTCLQFLRATSPDLAVVSVGADNEYGHPSPAVLDRLREAGTTILTTMDYGTIKCVTDGRSVEVTTAKA